MFKYFYVLIFGLFILLSCNNFEDNNIPDSVIQTFFNDNGKNVKLNGLEIKYLKENFRCKEQDVFSNYSFDLYELPIECGGCLEYKILNIKGKKDLSFSINTEYWMSVYSYIYHDTLNISNKILSHFLMRELNSLENNLNLFIELELENDNQESVSKVVNLILTKYVGLKGDPSIKGKLDTDEIELIKSLSEKSRFNFYSYKGTFVMVELTKNNHLKIEFLNPEDYKNVRF